MKKILAGLIVVVIAIVLTLFIFPKKDEKNGNGKRGNAIPNHYTYAYENRES